MRINFILYQRLFTFVYLYPIWSLRVKIWIIEQILLCTQKGVIRNPSEFRNIANKNNKTDLTFILRKTSNRLKRREWLGQYCGAIAHLLRNSVKKKLHGFSVAMIYEILWRLIMCVYFTDSNFKISFCVYEWSKGIIFMQNMLLPSRLQ